MTYLCKDHAGSLSSAQRDAIDAIGDLTYSSLLAAFFVNLTALDGVWLVVKNFSSGLLLRISHTVHIPSWEATANLRLSADHAVENPPSVALVSTLMPLRVPDWLQSKRCTSLVSPTATHMRAFGEMDAMIEVRRTTLLYDAPPPWLTAVLNFRCAASSIAGFSVRVLTLKIRIRLSLLQTSKRGSADDAGSGEKAMWLFIELPYLVSKKPLLCVSWAPVAASSHLLQSSKCCIEISPVLPPLASKP